MAIYRKIFTFAVIVLKVATLESSLVTSNDAILAPDTTVDKCFKKDFISCLQMQIYRSIKLLFDQDRVNLTAGFSLVREKGSKNQSKARTPEDVLAEERILGAQDFKMRESAIESFLYQKIIAFFDTHAVRWNVTSVPDGMAAARATPDNLPAAVRERIGHLLTEREFESFFFT